MPDEVLGQKVYKLAAWPLCFFTKGFCFVAFNPKKTEHFESSLSWRFGGGGGVVQKYPPTPAYFKNS